MMAGLFLLMFIAALLAWRGMEIPAKGLFAVTLVLVLLLFMHHVTDKLNIDL